MIKTGDQVPYVGTRGVIMYARIDSFESLGKGRIWFRGTNVKQGGHKVFKPLYKSEELIAKGY